MQTSWPAAAATLARTVTRRERLGAFCTRAGAVLGLGAALALAASRWAPPPTASLVVALAALVALASGLRAASRVRSTPLPVAAWALDRLAAAGESGLTSALAPQRPLAASPPPPPGVRLKPPAGLPLALGGALLAALAALTARGPGQDEPLGVSAAGTDAGEAAAATAEAGRGDAAAREERAQANSAETVRRAVEAQRVRAALGLPAAAAEDAAAVAERLQDPSTRAAALAAAEPDGALARALASGATAPADVARALANALEAAGRLEAARRQALDAALDAAPAAPPPGRAALVARYFAAPAAGGRR